MDEKIVAKVGKSGEPLAKLTSRCEREFWQDMLGLGVERPTVVPRATQYIREMVDFMGRLVEAGFAYKTPDGSVYLDSFKAKDTVEYPGALGGNRLLTDVNEGDGKQTDTKGKRAPSDFALWKSNDQEPLWDAAPWGGKGRPGWHLECSSMIEATLGNISGTGMIDIHGGGVDLCFPHHANEQCQSQLSLFVQGVPPDQVWSTFFCHTGHVLMGKEKMSKSLGNFSTIREVLESKQATTRILRLMFLSSARYASNVEWNYGAVQRASALDAQLADALSLKRISASALTPSSDPVCEVSALPKEGLCETDINLIRVQSQVQQAVEECFADDFDFPGVFEQLQKLCREMKKTENSNQVNAQVQSQVKRYISKTLRLLGFTGELTYDKVDIGAHATTGEDASAILDELVDFRNRVRLAAKTGDLKKVLEECDVLRNTNPFVAIQDNKDGSSTWKRR